MFVVEFLVATVDRAVVPPVVVVGAAVRGRVVRDRCAVERVGQRVLVGCGAVRTDRAASAPGLARSSRPSRRCRHAGLGARRRRCAPAACRSRRSRTSGCSPSPRRPPRSGSTRLRARTEAATADALEPSWGGAFAGVLVLMVVPIVAEGSWSAFVSQVFGEKGDYLRVGIVVLHDRAQPARRPRLRGDRRPTPAVDPARRRGAAADPDHRGRGLGHRADARRGTTTRRAVRDLHRRGAC